MVWHTSLMLTLARHMKPCTVAVTSHHNTLDDDVANMTYADPGSSASCPKRFRSGSWYCRKGGTSWQCRQGLANTHIDLLANIIIESMW